LSSGDPTTLEIEAEEAGTTYVVRIRGELDQDTSELLERALAEAERSAAERILLDLDGLAFIDSAGLRTVLGAKRRADGDRGRLKMTRGTGEVAEMFRLTAMDLVLPFE
jgi:anti-anti-sigma factor